MEPVHTTNVDRRNYNRTEIDCQVVYKLVNEETYKDAVLVNLSEAGALIGINEKLELDTQLYLQLESTEENQQPIKMLVETIRSADTTDGYSYCYGCMILDVF
ncbi:MAG: PilZ domain-containing protein [Gammaproteobacteria bacterium]|nr:PilZ domain-containing protein [Gammaproteobacteria bacterium]